MIKPQISTLQHINTFVRNMLMSIYGESFYNYEIQCARTYSESYNDNRSWRYKWYELDQSTQQDVYVKMIDYANEVLDPHIRLLFNVSIKMKMLNGSLTLLTKCVKQS